MNPSTTSMTLNMQLPNIAAVAWAVQGDQLSRYVECTLADGSAAWNPQAGYHGVIRAHKPDGTACVYDVDEDGNPAVTWTGNVATVTIAQQAVTVAGTVLMQLEFYDSNNARITAFGWAMNVQPSAVTDTEFLSTDYYNILSLQIAGVLGASGHAPYINSTTKNWMIWDENASGYIDSGYSSVGLTGPAPVVTNTNYQYANSNSGTVVPSSWSNTRPATQPGTWAWTKTVITFDNNTETTLYDSAYQGNDGTGAPGSQLPLRDGIPSAGTSNAYSREDHVHPTDATHLNLLDNWYFVGGGSQQGGGQFPINQRGGTSYSGGFSVDRWQLTASNYMTLTVNNDSVRLKKSTNSANPKWVQVYGNDDLVGKTVTLSILYKASYTNDNSIKITIGRSAELVIPRSSSWNCVSVTGTVAKDTWGSVINAVYAGLYLSSSVVANTDYIDIAAIKLELGTTQTLAHQESGTWVLNEIPDFDEQLYKCCSSIEDSSDTYANLPYTALGGISEYIRNKKIAIFGDSWSDENIQWSTEINDVWVKTFRTLCAPFNATISNYSRSSRGWCVKDNNNQYTGREIILNTDLSNIDTVILFLGLNDFLQGIWTSNCNETQNTAKLWGALHSVESALAGKNVFVVTPGCVSATGSKVPCATLELYRIVLANWAKKNAYMLINGSSFPQIKYNSSVFANDKMHVKNAYQPLIAKYILEKIVCAGEAFSPFIEIANYTPTATPSNGSFNSCSVKYNPETIELNISGNITDISNSFDASDLDAPSITTFVPRVLSISLYNRALMTAYVSDNNTTPKGQLYVARPSFVSDTGQDVFSWVATGYSDVLG